MWTKIGTVKQLDHRNKPVTAFLKFSKNGPLPVGVKGPIWLEIWCKIRVLASNSKSVSRINTKSYMNMHCIRRIPFFCSQILPDSTITSCSWITRHVVGIADSDWLNRDKTKINIVFHFFWPIFAYLCTPSVAQTWSVCPLICKSSVQMIKEYVTRWPLERSANMRCWAKRTNQIMMST